MSRFYLVILLSRLLPVLISAASLSLTGCDRAGDRVEIKETREFSKHTTRPPVGVSSAVRFPDMSAREPSADEPPVPQENPLTWTTPEGWTELPSSNRGGIVRLIDLRFGPAQEGQCYLVAIDGAAGGLEANVNRWRTQMGKPAYTAEEIAALPKKPFLNSEAIFVDFGGDFKDMGSTSAVKDYRLLGLIRGDEKFTLFVKLTGPQALVAANEAAFNTFCQSIQIKR